MKKIQKLCQASILMIALFLIPFIHVEAANPTSVTLTTGRTYSSYDITGDGKADTLKISKTGLSYGYYSGIQVTVNGKSCGTITAKSGSYNYLTVKLYTIKNGKSFLYLSAVEDIEPQICALYQYKSGKMKKVVDFDSTITKFGAILDSNVTITVSGNKLKVLYPAQINGIGVIRFTYTYAWKSGTLTRTSNTASASVTTTGSSKQLTAAKTIKVYTSPGSSTVYYTLKKGNKVSVSKCWISGNKMYIRVRNNGRYGWIKVSKLTYGFGSLLFTNATYVN